MPEAILLKDVETLGEKGTVVDVSKGYLRNYLIPRKLAQPATKGAIDAAQRRAAGRGARRAARPSAAPQEHAELLNKTVLTISQQAGDDGRLFGSVTTQDIADAIQEARGITSTAARSTSTSRSSTSAPTWSSSRSPTASPRRSRRWSPSSSRATRPACRRPPTGGLLRCAAPRRTCDDSAQACDERRRVCGDARGCRLPPLLRSAAPDEHPADHQRTRLGRAQPSGGRRAAALDRGRAVRPRRDPALRPHALRVRHRGGPARPRTSTASAIA